MTHLARACGDDHPITAVKLQASGIPRQAQELKETTTFRFQVGDHLLVLYLQHVKREYSTPVRHETLRLDELPAAVRQVVLEEVRRCSAEVLKEAGKTRVSAVASAEDHSSSGKQEGNQTKVEDIARHLVDDPHGITANRTQPIKMCASRTGNRRSGPTSAGHRIPSAQDHVRILDVLQLAGTKYGLVACRNLLKKRRARTWHADNEHGQFRTCAPVSSLCNKRRCEVFDELIDQHPQCGTIKSMPRCSL